MELECDLSKINNEELLRKMWQQSEDAGRKKEIRSQLYKLRETRLRDLYQGDIMADNSGFGKDPLATSHGDALADQSFQSLKSKEIRDSLSPTEMKFQSMALNNPNTTGWNVQSSKEVSPDGRGFRAETVATTDGVESINGGIAEFKGRNEQRSSAHHQGDDKNFVKKAMESSNSHLQEKVVIGDENSGRTEVRTSSSKSTSSSQVFQSSSNVEYDDGFPGHQAQPQKYLMDSNRPYQHDVQQQHQLEQQRLLEEQRRYEQQFQQQRQQHVNQQERRTTEQLSTTRQNTEQKNTSQNVQTQETHEQNKRYVDMDKASPEYQQHVQYLMQQPGEIISNTVEYPKPNVKMITTVKRLPDGTIVRNKRYETEELNPTTPSTRTTSTATNQTQPRRDSQQQPSRNYQPDLAPHSRPSQDMVDSSNTSRYVQDTHTDDVETKFSSIKKSSHKFNTESTSETIQEFDDRYPQGGEPSNRPKPVTNDFSTHGFPSVRSNKPTQEYPNERPHTERPTQGYPSQGAPAKLTDAMVPHYPDATDNITERRVPTKDGEVIIVSSEKKRNYKTSSNSERIVETEHVIRDDQQYQQIPDKSQDYTTHGFPSAREPAGQQPKNYPSDRQMQPHEQDFPLDKFSPGPRIIKHRSSPHGDDDVVVVSSQKSRTAKHSTNTERVIEHEIIRDDQPVGYPRIQPNADNSPYNYTVTTPGTPQPEFPGTPRKPNNGDYSTQGFPSVRTPGQAAPGDHEPYGDYPAGTPKTPSKDYSTQGFPSVKSPSRPAAGLPSNHNQHPGLSRGSPSHEHPTQGFPSVRTPTKGTPTQGYPSNVDAGRPNGTVEQPRATPTSKTQPRTPSPNKYKTPTSTVRETTERVIRKEKEVDSAHRAFAASLRSSSPIDHVRRDSYTTDSHTRHTPRSSVSSTRTFKRDMREGSHDSAPSETSRISTTTITRNTPPRTVGGRTVVTKVVTTKTNQGSNDTLNVTSPRATKSPSPGKTVTTTTTTRTMTSKDVPKVTEPTQQKKPSSSPQPSKTTKMSTTTTDSVAARRSLFESNHSSPSSTPTKRTPLTSPMSGRRPSYMDHTKSSLEHTRRDSLEINKTNYSRKPSHPEEEGVDRNSLVKFDVPQGRRATTPRATSVSEDINVEEIFDLEVLERLLETVQSYEIRRRIRAQIRLIKKNQKNELISSTTEVTTKTIKTSTKGSEEPDTVTTTNKKTKPETKTTTQTVSKDAASHISSSKKEYIFEEPYMPTTRRSPKPNRYPYETEKESLHKPTRSQSPQPAVCRRNAEHERQYERSHHSPEHSQHIEVVREYGSRTTKQQYYYKDEEELEQVKEIRHETSPSRKSPSPTRKPHSIHSSPERRNASPESHKPLKTNERSRSPQTKAPQSTRVTSSHSPDSKTSLSTTVRKSSATYEQQETMKTSSTKPQTKRITTTTTTITKSKPENKTPVWADRKNILKAPSSNTPTPKKPSNSTLDSRAGYTKTIKSTTSQKMSSNKSSFVEDDCVTSSYGIGPTDENGLPLFGIRALKKKKPTVEPSETTEVTGYVVEEKYYSDNKTKPSVERKEFIYSTSPEELQKLKDQVEVSTNRKALKDVELKESRQTALISKGLPALRSSPEDDFLDSTSKYVRRGSVKEMSEKFIQREASSTVTEKSNNYPKAGLILRTNSRKNSRDAENESDNFESYKTTRIQQHTSSVLADSDDAEHEYEVEEVASRHSGRFITESESECDSIKTQREFKKVTSSSSSSMATRSFLNTQGEEKVITNVSDCLERMRNADNVVEEGDTPEDQEARALLNKFLGASIIMKGVESSLPAGSNRQSKIITTTTTSSNLSDDNDGDNNAKNEVKTTRITKTIKSGSSSTPVTYTTCDIEEIWDEEILKELLEQARTYEERRKIRSRLRELMADREETKKSPTSGDEKEVKAAANVPEEEESSASEYEEIIEEVTDYSEAESEVDDKKQSDKLDKVVEKSQKDQEKQTSEAVVTKTAEESLSVIENLEISCTKQETHTEQVEETTTQTTTTTTTETETVEEVVEEESSTASKDDDDKTDSSEKEQKQQKSSTSTTEKTETKDKDGAVVTTTTKVTTRTVTGSAAKPASPFAKFKQLDRQNSQQSAKLPTTPTTPGGGSTASPTSGKQPIFRFTDPALNAKAATVKEQLLQWCQSKTQEYENIEITNFSTSWNNGLAFCALIHHFLPDAFDYSQLTPKNRRKNFELAFTVADEKAGIAPLLDVEDMVVMQRPDWKCVFVYVQSIYRRFRNCQ
ncbi:serine-rich adhesin for platelets isoform X6 [Lucilia sericata]|uniref:serine-rich adhesin for platelets isoform X6 n=1 Tax=Lucilia sericata TaxID=13632 RepID=UPI0018A80961|nr:serine-rich adhesin for platelets isoform X6 [Lucilia sericata]